MTAVFVLLMISANGLRYISHCGAILLERLIVSQLDKKFTTCRGTKKFGVGFSCGSSRHRHAYFVKMYLNTTLGLSDYRISSDWTVLGSYVLHINIF